MKNNHHKEHHQSAAPEAAQAEQEPQQTAPPPAPPEEDSAKLYLGQLIQLKADFENYRKRVEREKPELVAWGRLQMTLNMLPLYETMLKAKAQLAKTMEADKAACSGVTGELCKGMEMIFKEFDKLFAAEKIAPMDTVGKPYDPMAHEVLAVLDCPDDKDGLVLDEAQKGFTCAGKVIQSAKVCIGRKKEQEPAPATPQAQEKE